MAVLPVRLFPDPVLRTRAEEVTDFDEILEKLVSDMMETMYDDGGVGLAAPQVGISYRVFVFDVGDGLKGHVINPEWEPLDQEMQLDMEGCLSAPGIYGEVERFNNVKVVGQDMTGAPIEYECHGLFARCIQHEVDHLNGILWMQTLPADKRKKAMAEIRQSSWFGTN